MYVYDIRETTDGKWCIVHIDLDTGRVYYLPIEPYDTWREARLDADKRNRRHSV